MEKNGCNVIQVITSQDVFGPEKTTINECLALQDQGWKCKIVNLWPSTETAFKFKADKSGVPYLALPARRRLDLRVVSQLTRLFRKVGYGLVHSHGYKADVIALIAAWMAKIPIVTTIHGWTSEDAKVRGYEKLQSIAWRFYDRVFCVSDYYRRIALDTGVPADKLHLVYNGIKDSHGLSEDRREAQDLFSTRYHIVPQELVVGIVGRLSIEKGHELFLEAASQILKINTHVKFVIVGDGLERPQIESMARGLGINEHVVFTGHLDDMRPVYAELDLLAICSLREGLPNVLLEAMLNRIPVVSVAVGGIPEVISGECGGLLVEDRSPQSFADALMSLISDRDKRLALGQKGRERVETAFSFDERMRNVILHYKEVLDLARGRAAMACKA